MTESSSLVVLLLSGLLFSIGAAGVLTRSNVLIVLMCLELMLNAANLAIVTFASSRGAPDGIALALLVIVVAAIEAAVGLALAIALFRSRGETRLEEMAVLKG